MKLSLEGKWEAKLCTSLTEQIPEVFDLPMTLPGTTSQQRLGPVNEERSQEHLTDAYAFEGYLWLRRSFELPEAARYLLLTLERTRMTAVWMDGELMGVGDSLCTPHHFFAQQVSAGIHELVIRVSNVGYPTRGGHMTSPDTQTNWLGITGEISVQTGEALLWNVQSEVQDDLRSIRIRACVLGADAVRLSVEGYQTETAQVIDGRIDHVYRFPVEPPLWSLHAPVLLSLRLWAGDSQVVQRIGMRRLGTQGRKLLLNGRQVFLRGTHDGLAFPLTGSAPTDLPSWLKYFGTVKEWGMNHVRYHTCCPPEAAFEAADILGLCLEPELPFWGTIAAPGQEGYDEKEQHYLTGLGLEILRSFGSHPSFCMMSLGNELWGDQERVDDILRQIKSEAGDKLYTASSNGWQFAPHILPHEDVFVGVRLSGERLFRGSYAMCDAPQGIVQTTEPESVSDYDAVIAPVEDSGSTTGGTRLIQYGTGVKEVAAAASESLIPQVPVISHEIGQYVFYPDFNEMESYTGVLKPRNFEIFRERLQAKGLWQEHERFFRSAGRLAAECYRRELETAMRSEELAGFQLLDLKDFPGQGTALVGMLNPMMENKGVMLPEEWRRFCADTVVMARLPRFVLKSGDMLEFDLCVSECEPSVRHERVAYALCDGEKTLFSGEAVILQDRRRVKDCGHCVVGQVWAQKPCRMNLRLSVDEGAAVNEYLLWVFPEGEAQISSEGITTPKGFVRFVTDEKQAAETGAPVIVVPPVQDHLPAEYCSDFWCYRMFSGISDWMKKPRPVGTLGLCIDTEHPALSGFPCDAWTTPVWYRLLKHAHCQPLPQPCELPVQMIDNVTRAERLGILWVQDGVMHTTIRLWEAANEPQARAFAASLADNLLAR